MRQILTGMAAAGVLMVSGCTSSVSSPSIPVSNTPEFKQGQKDGCTTAHGEYVKNSELWHSNKEYQNGWFYGRQQCH